MVEIKEIKFQNKSFKDFSKAIDYIWTFDYNKIKKDEIMIRMSIEEFQKEIVNYSKEQICDLIEENADDIIQGMIQNIKEGMR